MKTDCISGSIPKSITKMTAQLVWISKIETWEDPMPG